MSDRIPPPGTVIISTGKVQAGDWFFITMLGAWALCPAIAYGEQIKKRGPLVARPATEFNTVKRDEAAWKN